MQKFDIVTLIEELELKPELLVNIQKYLVYHQQGNLVGITLRKEFYMNDPKRSLRFLDYLSSRARAVGLELNNKKVGVHWYQKDNQLELFPMNTPRTQKP